MAETLGEGLTVLKPLGPSQLPSLCSDFYPLILFSLAFYFCPHHFYHNTVLLTCKRNVYYNESSGQKKSWLF